MAAVAPSGAPSLPLPQSQSTPMQVDGSPSNGQAIPRISWEGDKMFNIYIHDYCNKRGFNNTARELVREADLGADFAPPINARQGLLFEWWSVFWVLFQAKSGNANSEDALLYMQHHNTQKARMNAVNGQTQPGVPGPLGGQPSQVPPNQPPQQQQQPGQLNMGRPPNGMPPRPPSAYINGAMPNGVMNPAMGGQPNQPGQMQGQTSHMSFAGLGGQPNGMAGGQQQPSHGGPQQGPGPQAIPFNPMMTGVQGPRTPMNGHQVPPGQQQGGRGPFQSPQMAHSPQTGGPGGGQQPQQGGPGPSGQHGQQQQQQQAPMAQLGPSPQMTPQMNRAMHPPNGSHPQNMGPGPAQMNPSTPGASGPPTPGFTPGGQGPNPGARPPSRARPTPSPSMTPRQPPGAPGGPQHQSQQQQQQQQQQLQGAMNMMGGMMGMGGMGVPGMNMGGPGGGQMAMPRGMGGMMPHPGMAPEQIHQELMSLPQASLKALMQEQGLLDKDVGSLAPQDKLRLLQNHYRNSMSGPQGQKVGPPVAGPSGMMMQGQPQQPQLGGPQQQRPGVPQHLQQPARGKRNSTSPAEDDSQPRNESSPPDRKRIKREQQNQGMPPGPYTHLGQPGGPPGSGLPGTPQQQSGQPPNPQQMAMFQQQQRAQMGMGMNGAGPSGHPGQPNTQGGHPVTQPPIGVPVMMNMPPGMNQQPNHFRPGPPGPPRPGQGPQFNPVPLTHLGKQNPGQQPQHSPGMNGPGKEMKDIKPQMQMQLNGQPSGSGPHPGSPRNQPGSAAHTPVPSNQPTPNRPPSGPPGLQGNGQGGPSQPPPPSQTPNQQQQQQQQQGLPQQPQLMNSMLPMPMNGMNLSSDLSMFDNEFMGMDSFDVFAKTDGDINFEREFGQWFTPTDDPSGNLDKNV